MTSFDIDDEMIRRLARLLEETGLTEIEFTEGQRRLRLCRGAATAAHPPTHGGQTVAASAPVSASATLAQPTDTRATCRVTSPMVGTAYLAAAPGGVPFVKVGDAVKQGQTVLIIEAMKVMNPIKAPQTGTITSILVTDQQPVEFGEELMVISPVAE